jgi:hypothetical protein
MQSEIEGADSGERESADTEAITMGEATAPGQRPEAEEPEVTETKGQRGETKGQRGAPAGKGTGKDSDPEQADETSVSEPDTKWVGKPDTKWVG